jgi:hypothetical protein
VEIPASYKTVTKQVKVGDRYETVTEQVVDKPAQLKWGKVKDVEPVAADNHEEQHPKHCAKVDPWWPEQASPGYKEYKRQSDWDARNNN